MKKRFICKLSGLVMALVLVLHVSVPAAAVSSHSWDDRLYTYVATVEKNPKDTQIVNQVPVSSAITHLAKRQHYAFYRDIYTATISYDAKKWGLPTDYSEQIMKAAALEAVACTYTAQGYFSGGCEGTVYRAGYYAPGTSFYGVTANYRVEKMASTTELLCSGVIPFSPTGCSYVIDCFIALSYDDAPEI